MRHNLSIYLKLIRIQVRSQMQYRASFLLDTFSTFIINGSYLLMASLVVARFENVAGWTVGEVAFLMGMADMSFALMDMIFSGFDYDAFSPMVRMGRFDQLLLRPVSITLQVLGSRFLVRRLGRFAEGFCFFCFALAVVPIQWTLAKALYLPVVLASLTLAFGSLFIIGSTITFWTVERVEAMNIFTYGGAELMSYPMSIYPGWLRGFFTYILPFIFMNYYPALFILEKPDPLGFPSFAPFLAPFVALGLIFAAWRFWNFGIRHYQGTGS